MANLNFYTDLLEACNASADFLRKKHLEWNNAKPDEKRIYSGEREFVSDLYHLLVDKNPNYRKYLLVDYMRPSEMEEDEDAVPDLVFRYPGEDCVVEIKAVVNRRKNDSPEPYATDLEAIEGDHDQLRKHYKYFETKIQVVAFLGTLLDNNEDKLYLESFKKWVLEKFGDTSRIKMIVC